MALEKLQTGMALEKLQTGMANIIASFSTGDLRVSSGLISDAPRCGPRRSAPSCATKLKAVGRSSGCQTVDDEFGDIPTNIFGIAPSIKAGHRVLKPAHLLDDTVSTILPNQTKPTRSRRSSLGDLKVVTHV